MSGSGWAYSWRSCLWGLFTLLTLGLALPWRESALERYKMRHLHYGDLEGRFDATGWGLFKRGWWLWLLSLPIITVPLTYPAYKAVLWRWWLSGIRFGEVRFESDLRTGALMNVYWAVFGWIVVLLIIDGLVVSSVGFAALLLSSGQIGAGALVEFLRQYPYLVLGANLVNYLVVGLCAGIVVRVYLVRGVRCAKAFGHAVADRGAAVGGAQRVRVAGRQNLSAQRAVAEGRERRRDCRRHRP
jgi:uncharacterized membrane protein YjgN (DUF898 family)